MRKGRELKGIWLWLEKWSVAFNLVCFSLWVIAVAGWIARASGVWSTVALIACLMNVFIYAAMIQRAIVRLVRREFSRVRIENAE